MAVKDLRPNRLPIVTKVYESHLAQPLRPLACALAWFANDVGGNIYASVGTLSGMLQCDDRSVQRGLHELRELGVLTVEGSVAGGRTRSTNYRFNLDVLAALPAGHVRPTQPRKRVTPASPFTGEKGDVGVTLCEPERVTLVTERVTPVAERVTPASPDPKDPKDPKKETGAGAPALTVKGTKTEEPGALNQPHSSADFPFKVYAAIATAALDHTIRALKTDDYSSVTEEFKTRCAQHKPRPLPYDGDIARKAVEAAMFARNKAAAEFRKKFRDVVGRPVPAKAETSRWTRVGSIARAAGGR